MSRLLSIFALVVFVLPAYARDIDGVSVPESMTMAGTSASLRLNGAGLRTRYMAKIYVAGLYLEKPATTAEAVLESNATRVVALHLRRNSDSEQVAAALIGSVVKNHTLAEMKPLQERLNQFKLMMPDLKRSEVVYLEFLAGGETRVRVDNDERGTLKGADFQRAMLKIWLGEKPVDGNLKQQLLAGSAK